MENELREIELVRGLDIMGENKSEERVKLFRFLCIFHPELSLNKRLEITNAITNAQGRRK
jgi:hypothetical protein